MAVAAVGAAAAAAAAVVGNDVVVVGGGDGDDVVVVVGGGGGSAEWLIGWFDRGTRMAFVYIRRTTHTVENIAAGVAFLYFLERCPRLRFGGANGRCPYFLLGEDEKYKAQEQKTEKL